MGTAVLRTNDRSTK